MPMLVREIAGPDTMPSRDLQADFVAIAETTQTPSLEADLNDLCFGR